MEVLGNEHFPLVVILYIHRNDQKSCIHQAVKRNYLQWVRWGDGEQGGGGQTTSSVLCCLQIVHHFSCHHQTKEAKRPQKKGLVNLTYYEVINKNSGGGVQLFELTWHNVYGGKNSDTELLSWTWTPSPLIYFGGFIHVYRDTRPWRMHTQVYPLTGSFLWGVGWWEGARAFFHIQF